MTSCFHFLRAILDKEGIGQKIPMLLSSGVKILVEAKNNIVNEHSKDADGETSTEEGTEALLENTKEKQTRRENWNF